MQLLESKKIKLPKVFFISDREDIKKLPVGIPFIYGSPEMKNYLIRLLEFEVIYEACKASGYPFDFKKILKAKGYNDIEDFYWGQPSYMDYNTNGKIKDPDLSLDTLPRLGTPEAKSLFKDFVRDSVCYVDIQKIKELKIFPVWLDKIENAISTNIHNFAVFNPNMYNKKLEGLYGGIALSSPARNLVIIDISGSIPKNVSSTCLTLAKHLTETFFADLMITGSISTLYTYEELYKLDVNTIYETNGMNNDQIHFKKLLSEEKIYNTAIVFGDNDHPGYAWTGSSEFISDEDGKKICKWQIKDLISFHVESTKHLAGYARWFTPTGSIERIADWCKFL